jgi:hypothetical protein
MHVLHVGIIGKKVAFSFAWFRRFWLVIDDQLPGFPHLLYVWHLHKNIQAHCKEFTINEEYNKFFSLWVKLVNAPTEEVYDVSKDSAWIRLERYLVQQ